MFEFAEDLFVEAVRAVGMEGLRIFMFVSSRGRRDRALRKVGEGSFGFDDGGCMTKVFVEAVEEG